MAVKSIKNGVDKDIKSRIAEVGEKVDRTYNLVEKHSIIIADLRDNVDKLNTNVDGLKQSNAKRAGMYAGFAAAIALLGGIVALISRFI